MSARVMEGLRCVRLLLEHLNGGAAYARYRAHLAAHHPTAVPLAEDTFHREEMQRRWNGIRRCC